MRSWRSISPTDCSRRDQQAQDRAAVRLRDDVEHGFHSLIYSYRHIRVKAYKRGVQAVVSGGVRGWTVSDGWIRSAGRPGRCSLEAGTVSGSRAELVPFHGCGAAMAFDANDATRHDELQRHAIVQAHGPIAGIDGQASSDL